MKSSLAAVSAFVAVLAAAMVCAMAGPAVPNLAGKWRPDLERSSQEKVLKPAAGDSEVVAPPK